MVGVATLVEATGKRQKKSTGAREISSRKTFTAIKIWARGWEMKTNRPVSKLRRVLAKPIKGTRNRLERKPTREMRLKYNTTKGPVPRIAAAQATRLAPR